MAKSQIELDALGNGSDEDEDTAKRKRRKDGAPRDTPPRSTRTSQRQDTDLRGRLTAMFERIATALENRGDDELAAIIREDSTVMAGGLVSLTRPFRPLRSIVVAVVAIIEPLLAFGRVLRTLAERWADRRARRAEEQSAQEQPPA